MEREGLEEIKERGKWCSCHLKKIKEVIVYKGLNHSTDAFMG